jgi:hypothetical protein
MKLRQNTFYFSFFKMLAGLTRPQSVSEFLSNQATSCQHLATGRRACLWLDHLADIPQLYVKVNIEGASQFDSTTNLRGN